MIIASLPTIPERRQSFLQVVRRILYEQIQPIHQLHVWLNGYKEIPADFPADERLQYHLCPENPGPWVRYRVVRLAGDNDLFATLDDDLVYPPDYVETSVRLHALRSEMQVLAFGGIRWDPCVESYVYGDSRLQFAYTNPVQTPNIVATLMGGVAWFTAKVTRQLEGVSFKGFEFNDDLAVSAKLQQAGYSIQCECKPRLWIGDTQDAHDERALYRSDSRNRAMALLCVVERFGFDPSSGWLQQFLSKPQRVLVVSSHCPPLSGSSKLHDYLCSMIDDETGVHLLAPVPASQTSAVQRNVNVPYSIHAVSVPEPGGRLDWFSPVRVWRNRRVENDSRRRFLQRFKVVMQKLQPTHVEWFGAKPPAWLQLPKGHETSVADNRNAPRHRRCCSCD